MKNSDELFRKVWASKEAEGFQYGKDALEQVKFGWDLAIATITTETQEPIQTPKNPPSVLHLTMADLTALVASAAELHGMKGEIDINFNVGKDGVTVRVSVKGSKPRIIL